MSDKGFMSLGQSFSLKATTAQPVMDQWITKKPAHSVELGRKKRHMNGLLPICT